MAQTRRVNNAALRWPMQATRATPRSQRASRAITVSLVIATTFVMHAMVGRRSRQLKMPRPDAYRRLYTYTVYLRVGVTSCALSKTVFVLKLDELPLF